MWVGWVTSDFHQYDPAFELHKVRTVTVTLGDEKGKVHERLVKFQPSNRLEELLLLLSFYAVGFHSILKLPCDFR